jgi:Tfp pilus assembly protein PilN
MRLFLLAIALSCVSCSSTSFIERDGTVAFHNGSAGEKAGLEQMSVTLPNGVTINSLKVDKDQGEVIKAYLMWRNGAEILRSAGSATERVINSVQ